GTDTRFAFGDVITTADASFKINFPPPLKRETPDKLINKVKPVGLYQPNPWGIYDMHGNLTEWCLDIYSGYKGYLGLPVDGSPNTSKGDQSVRIKRGGNWISPSFTDLRSARRDYRESSFANMGTGFRVVAKKK
ncbi:MAG TPA: SUMF1/EgtB/PvdO family nonheme iron enzyme, partial [Pyrinomonadaceae bacterium]|nr:SUMF1/EgtB/PvdO family nonheme iron enzyme [Pyrinomonadaceae bacterium]